MKPLYAPLTGLLFAAPLAAAFAGEQQQKESPSAAICATVVYDGVRVIASDGSPTIEGAVMFFDRRTVSAVGPAGEVERPACPTSARGWLRV